MHDVKRLHLKIDTKVTFKTACTSRTLHSHCLRWLYKNFMRIRLRTIYNYYEIQKQVKLYTLYDTYGKDTSLVHFSSF